MAKLQSQGVHHITLVGADRKTSVDFWEGVLGMPLVFEQPNLDDPEQNHLYFDPGDGRLITIFTSESWQPDSRPNPTGSATCTTWRSPYRARPTRRPSRVCASAALPTPARSIAGSCTRSTSASRSASCWSWPATSSSRRPASTHADVLREAHNIRVATGARNIADEHLADAIEGLSRKPAPKSGSTAECDGETNCAPLCEMAGGV